MLVFPELVPKRVPEPENGGRFGEIKVYLLRTLDPDNDPVSTKTGFPSITLVPPYSRSFDTEFCLPIGAISGHFQLQFGPRKPEWVEKRGIPETLVLVFPELVPKRVPEPENGIRIGELRE